MVASNDVNEEYRRYCMAAGHLFLAFGRVETLLASILKLHLASNLGRPEEPRTMRLASAIYGSMRFKVARDTIKRLLKIEETPKILRQFVEDAFAHLGHIEQLRDNLAHQLITPACEGLGGFWQLHDIVTTRDLMGAKFYVFDTDAVGCGADDLITFCARFGSKPVSVKLMDQAIDTSPIAWRYKPSMLKPVHRSKLKMLLEPQPQPPS